MERRKASPDQLKLLLNVMENYRELAIGKFTGVHGRLRQTDAWNDLSEKLNAKARFKYGAVKTPSKWQQAWRDWKSNVRKKEFRLRHSNLPPGSVNTQLTEAEQRILRIISSNPSDYDLPPQRLPETSGASDSTATTESNSLDEIDSNADPTTGLMLPSDCKPYPQEISLVAEPKLEADQSISSNEVTSAPSNGKLPRKKSKPKKTIEIRLLNLEEEKIRIERKKLLEKERSNKLRLKLEKNRLEIEKQRNIMLEKLLAVVESIAHRKDESNGSQ